MEFIEIQHRLVKALMKMPEMQLFEGRSSLLQGLPAVGIGRSQAFSQLDLNNIVSQLHGLGRLTEQGGTRPVIVVVDNALNYFMEEGEVANELQKVKKQLEAYYGGDNQPKPKQPVSKATVEALIFGLQRDTRLPFAFIDQARNTARSVARLTVPRIINGSPDGNVGYGTGWMIAPGILITNHHVIDARSTQPIPWGLGEKNATPADFEAQAQQITYRFDYHIEHGGSIPVEYQHATLLAASQELDYAIVKLNAADKIEDRQPISLVPQQPALVRGSRMNIVQHPRGGPLRFAIRNNFFVRIADEPEFILYQTDTEPGASGSPVCNDSWQVVALHHASVKVSDEIIPPQELIAGQPVEVTLLNEAIQIHDILNDLPTDLKQIIEAAQAWN